MKQIIPLNSLHAIAKSNSLLLAFILIIFASCENDTETPIDAEIISSKSIANTPRVLVNGVPLTLSTTQPEEVDGKVTVPAVEIFDRLGYTSKFNRWTRTLTCTKEDKKIEITEWRLQAKINGERINQSVRPYFKDDVFMIEASFLSNLDEILKEYDQDTKSVQLYYFDELDYGLYFYGKQPEINNTEIDAVGSQKFVKGTPNAFYDPNKPTIIWVHGWQNGGVKSQFKNNFHLKTDDVDMFVHNEWIEQGWNVAIFNWLALADELLPNDAESKINSATTNGVNMRWKISDGTSVTDTMPTESVVELFAKAYDELASTQENTKIRLAGSSFGGQVVLHGAEQIQKNAVSFLPSRIALLDIAWTYNYVASQDIRTNQISVRAAKALSPNVVIEHYRSSLLTTPLTPKELVEEVAFQQMVFSYAGNLGIELKHTAITEHYFWSLGHDAPIVYGPNNTTARIGLSASLDNKTVRKLMVSDYHLSHKDGKNTFDPSDDTFELKNTTW